MNKKELYESIMKNVAKQVKMTLNESFQSDKLTELNNDLKKCGTTFKEICKNSESLKDKALTEFTDENITILNPDEFKDERFSDIYDKYHIGYYFIFYNDEVNVIEISVLEHGEDWEVLHINKVIWQDSEEFNFTKYMKLKYFDKIYILNTRNRILNKEDIRKDHYKELTNNEIKAQNIQRYDDIIRNNTKAKLLDKYKNMSDKELRKAAFELINEAIELDCIYTRIILRVLSLTMTLTDNKHLTCNWYEMFFDDHHYDKGWFHKHYTKTNKDELIMELGILENEIKIYKNNKNK